MAQVARADSSSPFAVYVPVVDAILDCIPAAVHAIAVTSISEAALRASAAGEPLAANRRGAMPQMDLVLSVDAARVLPVMHFLASHAALQFCSLTEMTAVDYPERVNGRFEVTYVLWSPTLNARLIVKAMVDELTPLESVTPVFKNADWLERETWDMFGVFFKNHPDLRRLLTDYGFTHHPLRKDFPVQGYTEVFYSEERKAVTTRSVQLAQTQRVVSGQ